MLLGKAFPLRAAGLSPYPRAAAQQQTLTLELPWLWSGTVLGFLSRGLLALCLLLCCFPVILSKPIRLCQASRLQAESSPGADPAQPWVQPSSCLALGLQQSFGAALGMQQQHHHQPHTSCIQELQRAKHLSKRNRGGLGSKTWRSEHEGRGIKAQGKGHLPGVQPGQSFPIS